MENCPVCGSSVNTGDTSGLWTNKNVYLKEEVVESINNKLPFDLKSEKFCGVCIDYERWAQNGLVAKVNERLYKLKNNEKINRVSRKDDIYLELFNAAKEAVKCFTISIDNFYPVDSVDGVIMFDSGARSTSADNFNAGIWNVINDSIALQLGDTKKVEDAIDAAKSNIKLKALLKNCDTITGLNITYSDLAANGKILLHFSGTAGYVEKVNFSEEIKVLLGELNTVDDPDLEKEKILDNLNELALDLKMHKFHSKNN